MIRNKIKILFILLQGVLLIKNSAGQIFSGGSSSGNITASSVPCAARNILAIAGGSYSGAYKGSVAYSCTSVNLAMVGGSFNGYSAAASSGCSARTILSIVGGSNSGASKGSSPYLCTSVNLAMVGGSFNGYSIANSSACAAQTILSIVGGSYSGASKGSSPYLCNSVNLAMVGGSFNGYSIANSSACAARTILSIVGGSNSGAFKGSSPYLCSSVNLAMIGGSFNGYSIANSSACAARTILSVVGGSFSGAKSVTLACAAPAPLSVLTTSVNATCNQSNGSTTAIPSGGTSPYSYLWSPGNRTGATITGLSAGTYTVTVTEGNFAQASATATITVGTGPVVTTSKTNVSCGGGSNGTASVSVSGGTAPYTYAWSNGASVSSLTNLTSGTYTVTVNDASTSCIQSTSVTLTSPPTLVASVGGSNITCNGAGNGSASVTASGGTPGYSYLWSTGAITTALSSLSANTYTVTVTDANSCKASNSFTVTQPTVLAAIATIGTPIQCKGQTTTIAVSGSGGTPTYSGTGTFTVSAGSYSYTITDSHNCKASVSTTITEPSALSVSATSNSPVCSPNAVNFTSTVAGGTTNYSYSWSGPGGYSSTIANPSIANSYTAQTGTYTLIVTDANTCSKQATTLVQIDSCFTNLSLNLFIQGYYLGSNLMQPVMDKEGVVGSNTNQTDTIVIALRDGVVPSTSIDSVKTILMKNGSAVATFLPSVAGHSYYIVVKHRNALETWSKNPVAFTTNTSYSFITSNTQAYGDNMVQVDVGPARWALYSGNMNPDENIDLIDFPILDFGINNGLYGYYSSDLNGDGNTDLLDFPVLDANINAGVFSKHP